MTSPVANDAPATETGMPAMAPHMPWWGYVSAVVAVAALLSSVWLWQKVQSMQENLARQSAESLSLSTEAKGSAHRAQELSLETAAKLAVTDARLTEVALQRTQVEELIQSLSRSRDENLVADIDSAIRLAQQQAQLTGSVEPLMLALKTAQTRLARSAQPRLAPLQRAMARDEARIQNTPLTDTPALLLQFDELALLADDLVVANAVGRTAVPVEVARKPQEAVRDWSLRLWAAMREEAHNLVRVSKISEPDAALLAPEQAFFLRENFKLRVLNAKLGLMSRQMASARADLVSASSMLSRFFAPEARKTQTAAALLQQVQSKMRLLEVPRVDETMAALSTAAAGR